MASCERAMMVSYRLSIVTVALSVAIRPQFAIECLRRSNQQGVGHFGAELAATHSVDVVDLVDVDVEERSRLKRTVSGNELKHVCYC